MNKEGAAQTSLRLAHPSIPYDALGRFYRSQLANFPLGGNFDSRINLNLREDKGWTYGSSTGFSGGPELGSFRFSAEINKDASIDALLETLRELEEYVAEGMNWDEFNYLKNALGQRDALRYETPGAKLGLLSNVMRYDLPLDYRKRQNKLLAESTRSSLNNLASKMIRPNDLAIIMVGDAEILMPQLEELGYPIVQLNEDGYPL